MSRTSVLAQLNSEISAVIEECLPKTCTVFSLHRAQRIAHGSGWFYGPDLIVTNAHVLPFGSDTEMMIRSARLGEIRVKVRGTDPETDLAALHAPGVDLVPLTVRKAPPRVGEICLAIGTPLDEMNRDSVSLGLVSGLGRQVHLEGFKREESIQTDALINHGNSGGPMVDVAGQVIGVNFAGGHGIGYAIPSEVVRDVVPELIEHGSVARASIGVSITARGHKGATGFESRLQVVKVSSTDSPLRRGDLIISVNGHEIHRRYELMRLLNRRAIGTSVQMEIDRSGSALNLEVRASARAPRRPVDATASPE